MSWSSRLAPRLTPRAIFRSRIAAIGGGLIAVAAPLNAEAQTAASKAVAPPLVFDNVTVVDVDSGRLMPDQAVVVVGNRVQMVGNRRNIQPPKDARVVDATGKFLIPGLWDMHVHVRRDQDFFYPVLLATGVTGIRDVNQRLDTLRALREEIASGQRVGPRIVAAGRMVKFQRDPRGWRDARVSTPDEARTIVNELKAEGADFIKIHSVFMPRDVYFALAAEARRVGIPFAGHVPQEVTLEEASDSGQRSIEHGSDFRSPCSGRLNGTFGTWPADSVDAAQCAALAAHLAQNGTWFTPTLAIVDSWTTPTELLRYWPRRPSRGPAPEAALRELLVQAEGLVGAVYRAGMPMLAGTDMQVQYPSSVLRELELLAASGLTPLDALRTATLNPAKYLGATDSLGTVATGKLADLVLLGADPLTDIGNVRKIEAVVANGRYFDRAALDALLAELERAVPGP